MRSSLQAVRPCCALFVMLAVISLVPVSVAPAKAGSLVMVSGVSCAAYNNTQADFLERSHVRLYNPTTNPTGIYVVCGVPRVKEYVVSHITKQWGFVNIFFDSTLPAGSTVSCGIREYHWDATDAPAGPSTEAFYNAVTVIATKTLAAGTSQVADPIFTFTTDHDSENNQWTVTCDLKPGTGINSIDWNED